MDELNYLDTMEPKPWGKWCPDFKSLDGIGWNVNIVIEVKLCI